MIENHTNTENTKQAFPLAPPLKIRKGKTPDNSFLSFIDQIQDGLYGGSKLVRNTPRKTSDIYFIVRTFKDSIRSYRRNYSHKSVALFRTKAGGSTRANISHMTCSFVELDGSTDNKLKTQEDVFALIAKNNLPEASYTIGTSKGNFHVIWIYNDPLPWTPKNESYWISQQKRLVKLFQKSGFDVDIGASTNPCQNLRNPSQLNPYNFKRRCQVHIYKTYSKTSLRAIFRALNGTNIANPKPVPASTKLRRYSRANRTFTGTHAERAETLGVSLRTEKREIKKAIANGDLRIVARIGNNAGQVRTTKYESLIFIEKFPEVPLVSIKDNALKKTNLLTDFQANGAEKGYRNKTLFALGLEIKSRLGKTACMEAIRAELKGGAMRSHFPERGFERTLKNIMKSAYSNPLGLSKMREWGLIEGTGFSH